MCFGSTCPYDKIFADNLHTSVWSEVTAPIATAAKKVCWDHHIQWWNFKRCHSFCLLLRHVSRCVVSVLFLREALQTATPGGLVTWPVFSSCVFWPLFSLAASTLSTVLVRVLVNSPRLIHSSSKHSALFWILRRRSAVLSCFAFSFCLSLRLPFCLLRLSLWILLSSSFIANRNISEILLHELFSKTCDANWKWSSQKSKTTLHKVRRICPCYVSKSVSFWHLSER